MKIGIITQPLRANYGGVLQNYALQCVLKNLGHQPVTIDFAPFKFDKNLKWYIRLVRRFAAKNILGIQSVKCINHEKQDLLEYCVHRHFIDTYIDYTVKQYPLNQSITKEENFDAYIAGSDQVWRPYCHDFIDDCYFSFAQSQSVIKMSYAASFGLSEWTYTESKTIQIKEFVKTYKAISVREDDAVRLCKKYLGVDAEHVVDPTMLLRAEQYRKLLSKKDYIYDGEVLVYILDMNKKKEKLINEICSKIGKRPFFVGKSINGKLPSIESWIAGFDRAKFVITDSFHGTVFSIIFGKQFVNIENTFRGLSRILSLFKMLGITNDRIISQDEYQYNILNDIDYNEVYKVLDEKRIEAFNFIQNNLK